MLEVKSMDAILDARSSWDDGMGTVDYERYDSRASLDNNCVSDDSLRSRSVNRYENDRDDLFDAGVDEDYSVHSCKSGASCCNPRFMEEVTANLLTNNPEFSRLELEDSIEDISRLIQAIKANMTVREVEIHIEALEGLSRIDQRYLADAICNLPELRSLLVYKNSLVFVEPLLRHQPFLLEQLRLCKLDISEPSRVKSLVSALRVLPNLTSLDVGFDGTDSDGVLAALVQLRSIYVYLECFRIDYKLQDNDDTDSADSKSDSLLDHRIVVAIAEAVEQSRTLKLLSLPPFSCTELCYEKLINMLQRNTTLERIDYWVRICNLYYPDANEKIDDLLHLNQSGARRLVRQDNVSAREILQFVTDRNRNDDLDSLYHLLLSRPSVLPTPQIERRH